MFHSGITHEEMVQESKRHWQRLEQNAQKQQKVRQKRELGQFDNSVLINKFFFSPVKFGSYSFYCRFPLLALVWCGGPHTLYPLIHMAASSFHLSRNFTCSA